MKFNKTHIYLFAIAVCCYFFPWLFLNKTGINSLPIQSEDVLPTMFLPYAIVKDHSLYLDNYYKDLLESYPHPDDRAYTKGLVPYYLRKIVSHPTVGENLDDFYLLSYRNAQVHYASAFPIIAGIVALPIYLLPIIFGVSPALDTLAILMHLSASVVVAFSGVLLFYLAINHFDLTKRKALYIWLIFGFATTNLSMLSQALWQHGVVNMFLLLSLIFLYRTLKSKELRNVHYMSFFLGVAILTRPTAILPAASLVVLLLSYHKVGQLLKLLIALVLGMLPPLGFFVWYNQVFYKSISNQGYFDQAAGNWLGNFPESFIGIWLSPSKGILIYSPIFLFALVGLFQVLRTKSALMQRKKIDYLMFAIIVFSYTLLMSKWKHWYGGYSYGYRMSSDVLPFLVLLVVPYLQSNLFDRTKKLFHVCLGISVAIHAAGLVFFDGIWHAAYDEGFKDTGWLWSLKNSELVFNARRVLVKTGLLEKACEKCLPLIKQ